MNLLAVIIPTLNEQTHLAALLEDLHAQRAVALDIIVADGGSEDETPSVASESGATLVKCERGRGRQMNAGRAATDATWLLFLHADSRLESPTQLAEALAELRSCGPACGHFRLRFRAHGPQYVFMEAKTTLNRPNTTNGDQGMMMAAALFDEIGGFDERLPFLEDQQFAQRARDRGVQWLTLPSAISTSARRFEVEGFGARYFTMAIIMGAWAADADEFFERMPDIYPPDPDGPLDINPLLDAVRRTLLEMGPGRGLKVWLRGAKFARQNLWQLFYAADILIADTQPPPEHPFLDRFDEWFEDGDGAALDILVAAVSFVVLNGALPALLRLNRRLSSAAER